MIEIILLFIAYYIGYYMGHKTGNATTQVFNLDKQSDRDWFLQNLR